MKDRDLLSPGLFDEVNLQELRDVLALVHAAKGVSQPGSEQHQKLVEAQAHLVQMIWQASVQGPAPLLGRWAGRRTA